jgi:ornithine carbamoyltransferase
MPSAPAGPPSTLASKDFISVLDLTHAELGILLDLAASMKKDRNAGRTGRRPLEGKHVALLFEKPSLRTRVTFVVAVHESGGHVIEPPPDVVFGGREAVEDVAGNLERWIEGVIVRTFGQAGLAAFAAAAPRMHVVNALTNEEHPCQAVADLFTLKERLGTLTGRTIAYVGDGNNVATSLTQAAVMLGMHVRLGSPKGFALKEDILEACRRVAAHGATITQTSDPAVAVKGADAVYTDVWTSMGMEKELAKRGRVFPAYQVNKELMAAAAPSAFFMHCLPAHRGAEVTDEVMDAPTSLVFDQAENRLHTQKALLTLLMG